MSALFTALLDQASQDDLEQLAQLLTPFLDTPTATADPPRWLNLEQACEYLATKPSRIYALVSAKRVPHHRDGTRLLFNREELDHYIQAGGAKRP